MKVVFHIVNYTNLCKPTVRMNKGKKIAITRPYDNVKDVNDSKDVWSLAVRVMDLWCVTGKYRQEQYLEMVIADKENDMIQLTVPYEELAKWKEILKENNTYTMLNFKVLKNDVAVKASTHPFRLAVSGATIIKPVDFPAIPLASFRFKDFGEILAGNYRNDLLIDVIGAFQDITNTNKKGTIIRSVTFLLKDASGLMIHATLWDEFAKQFFDAFNQANGPETIFIVLKHMRAREAQGIYPLCVTNTWSGTKVIINAEIPEIAEFKTRFAELPIDDVNASQQLSQLTQGSQITQQGDIMNKAHFLTLSEVNHVMHETICVTIAEIKKINANKYGWIYDGCNFCTKGVRMDNGQLKCRGNHINDEAKPRFRVEVEAVYKNDKAKFLLWDNDVASIIGMSAQELKEQLVEVNIFHYF
ncbi:replication protein A 70 kDa DNA-binding subunit C [Medicago truncatula]|uniref:replication protein A 70 kDa DNA-binding subunit C n=1 Tax=Medicago truncatula TaxID=3880 RepID=UPI0019674612|nr:replication protein A 70 kDa DNA-binding subunit C [Medicago truncatula]